VTHTTSNELGDAEYVEGFRSDDEALIAARARAAEFGCTPVSAAAGAALQFLTAALQARAVVEIGTGAGVSSLHLLRGMAPEGVLTSIDIEPEYHRAARKAFLEAGFPPGRTRLIMGRALDVLPRLTHGGYDLVFVDSARVEYPSCYEKSVALLRPGGVLAFHNVLIGSRANEPNRRRPELLALRELARAIRDDDRLVPAMLPVGGGLLVAAAHSS
jgi:predicted O-methyltransferase YrrM